jgi:predicted rRNA methylase YqxC with S4 and FtsJ domains
MAVKAVIETAQEIGRRCLAALPSALPGAEGNREFFVEIV